VNRAGTFNIEQPAVSTANRHEQGSERQANQKHQRGQLAVESLQPLQMRELSQGDLMLVACCTDHSLVNFAEQRVDLATIEPQHGGRVAPVDRGEQPVDCCEVVAVLSQDAVHEYSIAGDSVFPDMIQLRDKTRGCRPVKSPNIRSRLEAVLAFQRLLSSHRAGHFRIVVGQVVGRACPTRRDAGRLRRPHGEHADGKQDEHQSAAGNPAARGQTLVRRHHAQAGNALAPRRVEQAGGFEIGSRLGHDRGPLRPHGHCRSDDACRRALSQRQSFPIMST